MTESNKRGPKAAGRGASRAGNSKTAGLKDRAGQAGASASPAALVKTFAESALGQTNALEEGNAALGEKHAIACSKAFDALRAHGNSGREALMTLFEHEAAAVRTTAAVFLLGYSEERALAVLEAEATGEGLPAFVAAQALERWQEGDWDLDPE